MNIGAPVREIQVEPLVNPVPQREEKPATPNPVPNQKPDQVPA